MSFPLFIQLKPNGQKFNKAIIVLCVLIIICGLIGCEEIKALLHEEFLKTDASNDWTIDLIGDYQIWRINERSIILCRKHTDDSGATDVIENFFVTRYCLIESYICVEGIPTKADFITKEEKEASILQYYMIETEKSVIEGPFESFQKMEEICCINVPMIDIWFETARLG